MKPFLALLVCCCFFLGAQNAEAARFPVLGFPFRVGVKVVKGANQVRLNRMEARAGRGNRMAAARIENVSSRKAARANTHCSHYVSSAPAPAADGFYEDAPVPDMDNFDENLVEGTLTYPGGKVKNVWLHKNGGYKLKDGKPNIYVSDGNIATNDAA